MLPIKCDQTSLHFSTFMWRLVYCEILATAIAYAEDFASHKNIPAGMPVCALCL